MNIKEYIDTSLAKDLKYKAMLPQLTELNTPYSAGLTDGRIRSWEALGKAFETESKRDFEKFVSDKVRWYKDKLPGAQRSLEAYQRGILQGCSDVFNDISEAIKEKRFEPTRDEIAQSMGFADELDMYLYHRP